MRLVIDVDGIPAPQPRPRAYTSRWGTARVYDPGTADAWRQAVGLTASSRRPRHLVHATGPVQVAIEFRMPRPQSHYTARGELRSREVGCAKKPDLDNLIKAVLDALTEVGLWRDDGQICSLSSVKRYIRQGEKPGARIEVSLGDPAVLE